MVFPSLHQHYCLEMPTCHLARRSTPHIPSSCPLIQGSSLCPSPWNVNPREPCFHLPPAIHAPLQTSLNSSMSHEIANIQLFFTQKNSNFMKSNLTELSMIPSPVTIRHSMSVHLINANICPLLLRYELGW